jgi:hypothetical protein
MRAVSTLVLGAMLCASPVARAEDEVPGPPDDPPSPDVEADAALEWARAHHAAGTDHFEAGDYEAAIREWERAYGLSGRAELLYDLSRAHERLGRLGVSHDYLRRFLAEAGAIPTRTSLERHLASLAERVQLARRAEGRTEPAAQTIPERTTYVSSGTIVGFLASGVGFLTFVIAGGLAIAEDLRLRNVCATRCFGHVADDLRTFALISDLGLGLTIVGAGLGLLFFFTDRAPEGLRALGVAPWIGGDGGGVIVRGRL